MSLGRALGQLSLFVFLCLGAGTLLAFLLNTFGVALFDFSNLAVPRGGLVLGVLVLMAAPLIPGLERFRLPVVVAAPFLTQYYQTALGWDVPNGATSLIRILPFAAMLALILPDLPDAIRRLSRNEQIAGLLVMLLAFGAWVGNADQTSIGWVGFGFLGVLAPGLFAWVQGVLARDRETAQTWLLAALTLAFAGLCLGTLVVIRFGLSMGIGGSAGLLGLRNVSDFNTVISYLILLWPFAMIGASRVGTPVVGMLAAAFLAASFVGLSRVGIVAGPVLVIVSLAMLYGRRPLKMAGVLGTFAVLGFGLWMALPNREMLAKNWSARFNVVSMDQAFQVLERVQPGGEDSQSRDEIREEGLRLFRSDPVLGQGFGGFASASQVGYGDAHSLFFTTLAEFGVVGFAVGYGLLALILLRLLRATTIPGPLRSAGTQLFIGFLIWVGVAHTIGVNWLLISERSFIATPANALLITLYFRIDRLLGESRA